MRTSKAIGSALVIAVILVLIVVYAFYKGQPTITSDGTDATRQDGVGDVPPDAKDLNHNEI